MKKILSIMLSILICCTLVPIHANAEPISEDINVSFLYTNTGVTASADGSVIASTEQGWIGDTSGDGFLIEGTTVTIDAAGKFNFSGCCNNGNIIVPKGEGAENRKIEINLEGLNLTEPDERQCPIEIKGGTNRVEISVKKDTQNVLTDANHNEVSPKACINASKKLVIKGKGKLIVNGNNKNGIKSDTNIEIKNLNLNVNSVGDGIKADEELNIESGKHTINASDDAIKSDEHIIIGLPSSDASSNPSIDIQNCFEGIEAIKIDIYGGKVKIRSADDGINATVPKDYPSYVPEDDIQVNMFNGHLDVIGGNDGIDSNGTISLLGGKANVFSSTRNPWGDGALDYNAKMLIQGAIVLTGDVRFQLDHCSMPSNDSQNYIFKGADFQQGEEVTIIDSGEPVELHVPIKVSNIFYSSPTLTALEAQNQTVFNTRNGRGNNTGGAATTSNDTSEDKEKLSSDASGEASAEPTEPKLLAPIIKKLIAGKKSFTVTWKKVPSADGYRLQYSTTKTFKKGTYKKLTIAKNRVNYTVKKLKADKKYYVRMRSYKVVDGKKMYSSWSKTSAFVRLGY